MASAYLQSLGYEILQNNYRNSYGEIDVIAKDVTQLVFCEIKFRSTNQYGAPLEAVDIRKQRKISRVAMQYYISHGYEQEIPCRFDVIGIDGDNTLHHIKNAFDFR